MAAKSTSSANYLSRADAGNPTVTGDWTIWAWVKVSGFGTTFTQVFGWSGGADSMGIDTDEIATDSVDFFVNSGAGFDAGSFSTGGYTDYVYCSIKHTSGSANYVIEFRKEGETSLSTDTITNGAQLTLGGGALNMFVFWDGGGPNPNTSIRPFGIVTSVLSTGANLTQSQSLADPTGTHTFMGLSTASDTTNSGSGGAFTLHGTLTTDSDNPTVTLGSVSTDQEPLRVPLFPPSRHKPLSRFVEVVAPVGALIVAGGLSTIGWGPSTPLPQPPRAIKPLTVQTAQPIGRLMTPTDSIGWNSVVPLPLAAKRPNPPVLQPTAPIGTGTFALTKFSHSSSTPLPPRALRPNPAVLQPSQPVGTLLTPSDSLGWFQIDASPPRTRRLVISAGPAEIGAAPTGLTSLGWMCDPAPRTALSTIRKALEASQPTGPLVPFVSPSTGWFPADCRKPTLVAKRVEPSAPTGPLAPFVSVDTGWLRTDTRAPIIPAPRAQESQQPTGPLTPFVSLSTGWLTAEFPAHPPVIAIRVAPSEPVGNILTGALPAFGWNAEPQARPAPLVPRRVETAAPIGTAFAIALPSTGWLATDNPRTPYRSQRSTPNDPVGSLLVAPPLPSLAWLATDDPRTPWRVTRAVVVDPVGSKFFVPPALGPYWYIEQPRSRPVTTVAPLPVDPPAALSTLGSLGWLAPPEAGRASTLPFRVAPIDPFGALPFRELLGWLTTPEPQRPAKPAPRVDATNPFGPLLFGGAPWADITSSPARVASRRVEPTDPVGALQTTSLPSFGWFTTPTRAPVLRPIRVLPAQPVGAFIPPPAPASGFGWLTTELPARALAPNASAKWLFAQVVTPPPILTFDAVGPVVSLTVEVVQVSSTVTEIQFITSRVPT